MQNMIAAYNIGSFNIRWFSNNDLRVQLDKLTHAFIGLLGTNLDLGELDVIFNKTFKAM